MNVLPFTLFVLMLMTLVTITTVRKAVDRNLVDQCMIGQLVAHRAAEGEWQHQVYQLAANEDLRYGPRLENNDTTRDGKQDPETEEKENPPSRPATPKNRKPQKRKLNDYPTLFGLGPILTGEEGHERDMRQEIAINLMDQLYHDQSFFDRERASAMLDQLRLAMTHPDPSQAAQFEGKPCLAEHLGSFSLQDQELDATWRRLLRGKKGVYPSLLDYVTLETNDSKISLMQAPIPLIQALFPNDIATEVLDLRKKIRKQYLDGKDQLTPTQARQHFAKELEAKMKVIPFPKIQEEYQELFDYSLQVRPSRLIADGHYQHADKATKSKHPLPRFTQKIRRQTPAFPQPNG